MERPKATQQYPAHIMVVSEQQGKQAPRGRRSSLTPNTRERRKRKSWLSEIGKGHSPASTRRTRDRDRRSGSSSRNPTRDGRRKGKRFDVDSLSFSGLETPVREYRWCVRFRYFLLALDVLASIFCSLFSAGDKMQQQEGQDKRIITQEVTD